MLNVLIPSCLLFIFTSYSSSIDSIRVIPVSETAESENIELTIQYPEANELKNSLPIHVQVRVEGYPLGIITDDPRQKEIRSCDKGQTIRVVVDDNPYILLNQDNAPTDAFDNHDAYFQDSVETRIKDNIGVGDHLLRVYPAYSYGEAVRGKDTFDWSIFCFKKQGITKIDLKAPMITYNEPQGVFSGGKPILLDFLCHNCTLSEDGYQVRLSVDGKMVKKLSSAQPYYLYGIEKGSHKIKLELIDSSGKVVGGLFTSATRTISVR